MSNKDHTPRDNSIGQGSCFMPFRGSSNPNNIEFQSTCPFGMNSYKYAGPSSANTMHINNNSVGNMAFQNLQSMDQYNYIF